MGSSPPPDVTSSSLPQRARAKKPAVRPHPRPPPLAKVLEPEPPVVKFRTRGANRWRFVRAYTTTFQVIWSYTSLFWMAKLLGRAYRDQNIKTVHKENAKRVYATILELQGLFIKVGQERWTRSSTTSSASRSRAPRSVRSTPRARRRAVASP
jgi:hypothetical protein